MNSLFEKVNYSKGYPLHAPPPQMKINPDCVNRGYHDHPSLNQMVNLLGRGDAHKKMAFHPAHTSGYCSQSF